MLSTIQSNLLQIKQKKPLILSLTNYVTMDFMANALLAVQASPLMTEAENEIEDLIAIANALYINLGTINESFLSRAFAAVHSAKLKNIPIILDPVGAGASKLRTTAAKNLFAFANIIRGNASEILCLSQEQFV